ncbi:MAG: hypothetical protein J6V09_05075 [Clostridia bacterium]|nr:hypothetical protein [Clostridia bacterium]
MSKKSKRKAAARAAMKQQKKPIAPPPKKPVNKKALAVAVSALLLVSIIVGVLVWALTPRPIDYLKSDLSKYIKLSEGDYKGYTLNIPLDEANDASVERKIMQLRYLKRTQKNNGSGVINLGLPIGLGDSVKIYYRGYTLDENGKEVDIDGAINFFEGSAYSLGIGSLNAAFPVGMEEALIGKIPSSYPIFTKKTPGGIVEEGDVVYISYKAMYPDGTSREVKTERVDLSRTDLDSIYGIGFAGKIVGLRIGETEKNPISLPYDGKEAVYFDLNVDYATNCESASLTVSGRFPASYDDPALRGKTAYFDIYFKDVVAYDVPEYNEAFITDVLKISSEELDKFEGDTVVEKHRAMLLSAEREEIEESNRTLKIEAVQSHFLEKVKIKKLPKLEIEELYREYYVQLQTEYMNGYNAYVYPSLNAFAEAYLGLNKGESWQDYLTERAKDVILSDIIFFYIIRKEGIVPTAEEYQRVYDEAVEMHLDYALNNDINKPELDKITDPDEKAKKIAEIKAEMMEYYGEEYFERMAYYEFALDTVVAFATFA